MNNDYLEGAVSAAIGVICAYIAVAIVVIISVIATLFCSVGLLLGWISSA